MPAAGRQSSQQTGLACSFIEVKWLWVELGGERFHPFDLHSISARSESLAYIQIVEVQVRCASILHLISIAAIGQSPNTPSGSLPPTSSDFDTCNFRQPYRQHLYNLDMNDVLTIAGRTFHSRLFVGTGKYRSNQEMARCHKASGAEVATVAVRRVNLNDRSGESLLAYIDRGKIFILPNTAA